MGRGFFITGTDTEIGKTTATVILMEAVKQQGFTVAAMKPVSAGCTQTPQGLRNDDALLLSKHASVQLPYEFINPFAYEPPIAPHIAAAESGIPIDITIIVEAYQHITAQVEVVLVEGVGGWLVPIDERNTMADVAVALNLPIILTVGVRLGCLNHSLLSAASIINYGSNLCGWIANCVTPENDVSKANIHYLQNQLSAAYLGKIAHFREFLPAEAARNIFVNRLPLSETR
ncbi:dethiobiotin synthase [Kaarinaea lacus]